MEGPCGLQQTHDSQRVEHLAMAVVHPSADSPLAGAAMWPHTQMAHTCCSAQPGAARCMQGLASGFVPAEIRQATAGGPGRGAPGEGAAAGPDAAAGGTSAAEAGAPLPPSDHARPSAKQAAPVLTLNPKPYPPASCPKAPSQGPWGVWQRPNAHCTPVRIRKSRRIVGSSGHCQRRKWAAEPSSWPQPPVPEQGPHHRKP